MIIKYGMINISDKHELEIKKYKKNELPDFFF